MELKPVQPMDVQKIKNTQILGKLEHLRKLGFVTGVFNIKLLKKTRSWWST